MRAFLAEKTGGRRGWQKSLVESSGLKRQTITKWTNPDFDGYPDMEALAALAKALGVRTWEVVAALEGDAVSVSPSEEAAIRAVVERVLDERLGPRKGRSR